MIASIDFKDFKILRKARIDLVPFNLVIGPNGSGKTSVIEAIRRLRTLAALPIVPAGSPDKPRLARVEFRFGAPHEGLAAILLCTPDLVCDGLRLEGAEAAVGAWPALVSRIRGIRWHTLDHEAMARPCPLDAPDEMAENGANLPAAMHALHRSDEAAFRALVTEFNRILPEFSSVDAVVDGDKRVIEFGIHGESHRIRAADLSQGTLALLGILLITAAVPRPSLLCIEEIDRGLHPRVLREARDALYRLSHPGDGLPPCQIVATTHSPYLLDLFRDQLEEVIIAEKAGARASFRRLADHADLKELLSEASLGDLWFSGVLGGVPEEE